MSHELRTPLNAILGYAELLEEELEERGAPDLVDDVLAVQSSGRHLLNLITDLLDVAKIEAKQMSVTAQLVDLPELFGRLERATAPLMKRRGNTLHVARDEGLERWSTDRRKVFQILLNLLSNAAKFTEDGDIWLRARRDGEHLVLEVEDTGAGIPEDAQARIFEAFEQALDARTRVSGGTGLGLLLVKEFSHMLGGSVVVESTPGQGSTFRVTIAKAD